MNKYLLFVIGCALGLCNAVPSFGYFNPIDTVSTVVKSKHAFVGDLLFLPPHAGYRTLNTEHFQIVYPQSMEWIADESAPILETTHRLLSPVFGHEPSGRTTVILTDNHDLANGITSAIGHQGLVLYVTAPDPYSSIGEYDHWLHNLIVHEYTHYLTLNPTRGVFTFLRYIFGDLLLPNHLWPTWLAEGFAVYAETAFTRQGRGNSTFYATMTRDALAKGTLGTDFLEFDRVMGTVPDFPFGEGLYYAGHGIVQEMVKETDAKILKDFPYRSSGRIPFFLNGALEGAMARDDASFRNLWQNWIESEHQKWALDIGKLKNSAPSEKQLFTPRGISSVGARISPDENWIAYTVRTGHELPSLKIQNLKTRKIRTLDNAIATPGLSWSTDQTLFYTKIEFDGPYAFYGDIYSWSETSGHTRHSWGARAKDVAACGEHLVLFTSHQQGRSRLMALDLRTHNINEVYLSPTHWHVATPACDSLHVYFSMHGTEPFDAIYELKLSEVQERLRAPSRNIEPRRVVGGPGAGFAALFPAPGPEGLFFTRADRRYYDIAVRSSDGSVRTVAHSLGGYWFPHRTTHKFFATYFSSEGFQALDLSDKLTTPDQMTASSVDQSPKQTGLTPPTQTLTSHKKPYILLKSLAPRVWSPYFAISKNHQQYGASIVGWDDLDQFSYSFSAWYDSQSQGPGGKLNTSHRIGGFRLAPSGSVEVTSYDTAFRAYDEEYVLGLQLSRPFPQVFRTWEPYLAVEWAQLHTGGNYGSFDYSPEWRVGGGLIYEGRQTFVYSLTAEQGTYFALQGLRYQPTTALSNGTWKFMASINQLIPLWSHSVLSFYGYYAGNTLFQENLPSSRVRTGGQGTVTDFNPPLRGYPKGHFKNNGSAVIQTEFRIPISQVFHGYDTWPFFMRNHGLYIFTDVAQLDPFKEETDLGTVLAGAGLGFLVNTNIAYNFPLQLRFEFARGISEHRGGETQFYFGVGL